MKKAEKQKLVRALREEINKVHFFAPSDSAVAQAIVSVAMAMDLDESELLKGTRYDNERG